LSSEAAQKSSHSFSHCSIAFHLSCLMC